MIVISYENIELEWHRWCMLCKKGEFLPMKMSYNKTAGWWIGKGMFVVNQLKKAVLN